MLRGLVCIGSHMLEVYNIIWVPAMYWVFLVPKLQLYEPITTLFWFMIYIYIRRHLLTSPMRKIRSSTVRQHHTPSFMLNLSLVESVSLPLSHPRHVKVELVSTPLKSQHHPALQLLTLPLLFIQVIYSAMEVFQIRLLQVRERQSPFV